MRDLRIVILVNTTRFYPLLTEIREMRAGVGELLEEMGFGERGVEISLCDDREISRLNREFLQIASPTNVLSFVADEEDFLGSICISLETISRESLLYGVCEKEHFYRMLIHGLLHLAGYSHGDLMYLREEDLFDSVISPRL